jgi:hypothetical protein
MEKVVIPHGFRQVEFVRTLVDDLTHHVRHSVLVVEIL